MATARGRGTAGWAWIAAAALASLGIGILAGRALAGAGPVEGVARPGPCARAPGAAPPAAPPVDPPEGAGDPDGPGRTRELPGPWGTLRTVGLWLFPPLQNADPALCRPDPPPWLFPGLSRAQAEVVLSAPDLGAGARQALLRALRCDGQGCHVQPTADLVRGLSPGARSRIYALQLSRPGSEWEPLVKRLAPADLELWLQQGDLPADTRGRVRALAFPMGGLWAVADLPLLCAEAPDDAARRHLVRAWSFDRAELAKVRVLRGRDDPGRLSDWWGSGVRRKDLRSLFAAAVAADDVASIDVGHLLPFWARAVLYTYPMPDDPPYDCLWTALNFHHREPDPSLLTGPGALELLRREFDPVPDGPRRLGDLDLFLDPAGQLVHAAVYVAGDLYFTKNGASVMKPWTLSRGPELQRMYGGGEGSRVLRFRPRDP